MLSTRKKGLSRKLETFGQTRNNEEEYYEELRGRYTTPEAATADLLCRTIIIKDSLDQMDVTLELDKPVITFQSIGVGEGIGLSGKSSAAVEACNNTPGSGRSVAISNTGNP